MQFDPLALLQSVPGIGPALPYVALAIAAAAAAMPWLPRPSASGSAYAVAYALLNALAQNFRNAGPIPVAAIPSTSVTTPTH